MFELQEPQKQEYVADADIAQQEDALCLVTHTPEELVRLVAARNRYLKGELGEWTWDSKRLRFAQWLYQHGKISG